jgi:hypothetical protein
MERGIGLPASPLHLGSVPERPSFYALRGGAVFQDILDRAMDGFAMGRVIRGGAAFETRLFGAAPLGHLLGAVATIEVEKSLTQNDARANLKFGLETTLLGTLSFRYGEFDDHVPLTECWETGCVHRDRNYRRATRGFGLRMGTDRASIRLDYSKSYLNRYTVTFQYRP